MGSHRTSTTCSLRLFECRYLNEIFIHELGWIRFCTGRQYRQSENHPDASKCGPSNTFWTHVHLIYKPTTSFLINEQLQNMCIFKIKISSITTNICAVYIPSKSWRSRFLTSTNLTKQILKFPVGTLDLRLLRRCGVEGGERGEAGGALTPGEPRSKEVALRRNVGWFAWMMDQNI